MTSPDLSKGGETGEKPESPGFGSKTETFPIFSGVAKKKTKRSKRANHTQEGKKKDRLGANSNPPKKPEKSQIPRNSTRPLSQKNRNGDRTILGEGGGASILRGTKKKGKKGTRINYSKHEGSPQAMGTREEKLRGKTTH